jgi:LysM repeat protein
MKLPAKTKPKRRLKASAQRSASAAEYFDEEPNMRLSRAFLVVLILHIIAVGGIFMFNNLKHDPSSAMAGSAPAPVKAPAPSAAETVPEEEPLRIHYLSSKETIADVAAAYGVTVADIQAATGLAPGAKVAPGTELRIPPRSAAKPVPLDVRRLVETPRAPSPELVRASAPPTAPAAAQRQAQAKAIAASAPSRTTASSAAEPSGETYTVVKGDNPVSIARKFGVSYEKLLSVNNIDDPRKLQIGQVLIIPKKN